MPVLPLGLNHSTEYSGNVFGREVMNNLLIICLFLFGISGYANAANLIVSENFDNGSWGQIGHGVTGGDQDGTSLTTDNAHSGNYAAKVDYSNGNNLNHWYDGVQNQISNEHYVSFCIYHDSNWKFNHNHKLMRLTNSTSNFYTNHEFLAADTFLLMGLCLLHPLQNEDIKITHGYLSQQL